MFTCKYIYIYICSFLVFTCLVCNPHSEKDGSWKQNDRKLTLYFFAVSKIHKCIHMYDSPQITIGESMDHTIHYTAASWIFSNLIEKSSSNASRLSPYLTYPSRDMHLKWGIHKYIQITYDMHEWKFWALNNAASYSLCRLRSPVLGWKCIAAMTKSCSLRNFTGKRRVLSYETTRNY